MSEVSVKLEKDAGRSSVKPYRRRQCVFLGKHATDGDRCLGWRCVAIRVRGSGGLRWAAVVVNTGYQVFVVCMGSQ